MNNSQQEVDWKELKSNLNKRLVALTNADLSFRAEERELMYNKVQAKLGKTREELLKIISIE